MASSMDLEGFVDAGKVEEGIGSAPAGTDYSGFEGDEESTETDDAELADEAGEEDEDQTTSEDEESEDTEDVEQEDSDDSEYEFEDEGEPETTGDKVVDGQNKAMWATRQKTRDAVAARQKLEQEVAYLKGQQEGVQKAPEEAPKAPEVGEPPEFDWGDPEKSVKAQVEWERNNYVAKQQFSTQQEAQTRWQNLVDASKNVAKQKYADYDVVEAAWLTRANTNGNEGLQLLLQNQPDPAAWAYQNQKDFDAQQSQDSSEVVALKKELAELKKQSKTPKPRKKKAGSRRSMAKARGGKRVSKSAGAQAEESQEGVFGELFSKKLA